jgi:hypothetical protein
MIRRDEAEVAELCRVVPIAEEAGVELFVLPNVELPGGCDPPIVDVLLCPTPRDGYESRLFFGTRVTSPARALNWNLSTCLLGRMWQAYSWRTPPGLRLAQMLAIHLEAMR